MDIEKLKEKIEQIDKETFKIFCDVSENKEISVYKNMLLNAKLDILESSLETTLITLLNTETKKINKLLKFQKLILGSCAVAFVLLFINPIIGLCIYLLNLLMFIKVNNKDLKETISIDETNTYLEKVKQMETLFQNCRTFLNVHTNYELEHREEDLENDDLRKIDLANEHIEIALLNSGNVEIPEEIQGIMIKMLQADLETDESDLNKLMQMTIEKEMTKINGNSIDLTRKRRKNEEN